MAKFDMITAAGNAYMTTWAERHYLKKMAIVPFIVKFICLSIAMTLTTPENLIRFSLIMLPAYFAEGWFLSHWARTVIIGHRWPFTPTGNDKKDSQELTVRGRGILSGMVAFAAIAFLMSGYFSIFLYFVPMDIKPENADPMVAIIGLVMMITTLLLFRFVWLYVALAVNIHWRSFAHKTKSVQTICFMIALWLVCTVPSLLGLQLTGGLLTNLGGDERTMKMLEWLAIAARVAFDMIKNLICTAGFAYALMELYNLKNKK